MWKACAAPERCGPATDPAGLCLASIPDATPRATPPCGAGGVGLVVLSLFLAFGLTTAAAARSPLGSSPGFYGTLKPLRFGMTRKEVRSVAPFLADTSSPRREPLIYGLNFDTRGRLETVDIHFVKAQPQVMRALQGAWGAGRSCSSAGREGQGPRTFRVWVSSDRSMMVRARLDRAGSPRSLTFIPTRMLTVSETLRRVTAEASSARVEPSARKYRAGGTLALPGPPFSDGVEARWESRAGGVQHIALSVSISHCREAAAAVDGAIRRWASKHQPQPMVVKSSTDTWTIRITPH